MLALVILSVLLGCWSFLVLDGYHRVLREWPTLLFLAAVLQICALLSFRFRTGHLVVIGTPLLAIGLLAPGFGAVIGIYLLTWDRLRLGPGMTVTRLLGGKANLALSHAVASISVTFAPMGGELEIPLKSLLYALMVLAVNVPLTGSMIGLHTNTSPLKVVREFYTGLAILAFIGLTFVGGVMYLLLFPSPKHSPTTGFIMSLALVGIVVLIRNAVQTSEAREREREQTLLLAAHALDARDQYTAGHSLRVSEFAARIGCELKLPKHEIQRLRTAASLHDIGKIGISDTILNKPDRLTDEEFAIIKSHPDIGADMIQAHSALSDMADAVRHHHEKWDGTGYPGRLAGESIPLHARIIAVADSLDTITTERVYRRSKMTIDEAVADIEQRAGSWFDPAIVGALRTALLGTPPQPVAVPMPAPATTSPASAATTLPATDRRVFGLLYASSVISALGDPISLVAVVTLVALTYRSPMALAGVFALRAVGNLLSGVLLGNLVDQVERKHLVMASDAVRAISLLIAAVLVLRAVWIVFPLIVVLSICEAIVTPARLAAVKGHVAGDFLQRALALLNTSAVVAGVVAYPAAGILSAAFSGQPSIMFALDATTFIASVAITALIPRLGGSRSGESRLRPGDSFVRAWKLPAVRPLLLLAGASAMLVGFANPVQVMLGRLFAGATRGGMAVSYAVILFAVGVGAVVGLILIQHIRERDGYWTQFVGYVVFGSFLTMVGLAGSLWVAGLVLALATIGNPMFQAANQTELLRAAGDDRAGAVMVTRFAIGQTLFALGALIAGVVVQEPYQAPFGFTLMGVGILVLAVISFNLYRRRRAETSPLPVNAQPTK